MVCSWLGQKERELRLRVGTPLREDLLLLKAGCDLSVSTFRCSFVSRRGSCRLLTGVSEHLASPQPVLPKGSDVANISKNNLSFLVWFGSGLTRWLTPMVLTQMGNGAATGTVIPH